MAEKETLKEKCDRTYPLQTCADCARSIWEDNCCLDEYPQVYKCELREGFVLAGRHCDCWMKGK